jgi:hypothetical protein
MSARYLGRFAGKARTVDLQHGITGLGVEFEFEFEFE